MIRSFEFVKNQNDIPLATKFVKRPIPTNDARYILFLLAPPLNTLLSIRSRITVIICSGNFSPNVPDAKLAIVINLVRSTGCGVMVARSPLRAIFWKVPIPSRRNARST